MVRNAGFTLIEMSIVLLIVGMLILTIFPAITALRMGTQRSATQSNLQSLMLATAAFVQANGCLPCPTPAKTTGPGFGHVRGDTGAFMCNGCSTPEGIPPFASLGITPNVAHDGWNRWMTMRVDPALTTAKIATAVPPTSLCTDADVTALTPTCTASKQAQKGLCQGNLKAASGASPVNVTMPGGAPQQVAVLFVSYGASGAGAFNADSVTIAAGSNGCRRNFASLPAACIQPITCSSPGSPLAYSECNASGLNNYIDAPPQDRFDDILAYADRNMIVSMLGNGTSCQTTW